MPYFACASGLVSAAMDTEGTSMNPVHLRLRHNHQGNKPNTAYHESSRIGRIDSDSSTNLYIKMSATYHARQLLDKMGQAHAAATVARNQLS